MTGVYNLAQNPNNEAQFNATSLQVQKSILRKLMGDHEYLLLDADLTSNGVPQTTKYINLINGVTYLYSAHNTIFQGLKEMLKGFIYYEINVNQMVVPTNAGLRGKKLDNSMIDMKQARNQAARMYNEAAEIYNCEANLYFSTYSSDFPKLIFCPQSYYRIN